MQKMFAILCISMFTLTSCAAPTPQPTLTPVPTSTRTSVPPVTATPTLRPPTASEPLWIQNGDELLIFDPAANGWKPAVPAADTALPIYNVSDGQQIIIVGNEWLAISSVDNSGEAQAVTTADGRKWMWGQDGWNKTKTQVEYWLNEDGTTKPGEVIPAGCLQVEGEDTCVLRAEASPQVYEGLLKVIYNIAVSFGQNPGGFYHKSGDYFKDKQAVAEGAEEFVKACMAGQAFGDLININNFPQMTPEELRLSQEHQVNQLPAMVYAVPFDATIDCRNIGLELVTNEEMEAKWRENELEGWWSTSGSVWWGRFEAVPLNDGSGRSRIVFSIGRLEDVRGQLEIRKLTPGKTSEAMIDNMGLFTFITGLDPTKHGTLSVRGANSFTNKRSVSLLEQTANMDKEIYQSRGEDAFQEYLDKYWGGGIAEEK
ncbi:MAG TPA: hypothetical protein PLR65_02215 [Anaerolineales bacterium]|nr:hypothetical protein [Anaerolineales bacterium]